MSQLANKPLVVGRIVAVYGVKGWVRVRSFTEPADNIFAYQPWLLPAGAGWQAVRVDQFRADAKGHIAHLVGVDDRDMARQYCQRDIRVEGSQFPALAAGEYYWHQLEGLVVYSRWQGSRVRLGRVQRLLETGANDVLVVQGDSESCDRRERLVPYAAPLIRRIDLDAGEIELDWDPNF